MEINFNDMNTVIPLAVAGGVLLIALIYGIVRKFSRLTWIGWQIPIILGGTLLLPLIPLTDNTLINYAIWAGGLALLVAVVLGIGGIVRWRLFAPKAVASKGAAAFDRILGGITSVLTVAVLLAVLGGAGLYIAQPFLPMDGSFQSLQVILSSPYWVEFSPYLLDVLFCAVLLIVMRGGYRLGILKGLYVLLMLLLVFAAFFGSLILSVKVEFGVTFSQMIGGLLPFEGAVQNILGTFGATLVFFLACCIVLVLISWLLNKFVRSVLSFRPAGIFGGILIGLLFTALFLAFACGVNYLISVCSDPEQVTQLLSSVLSGEEGGPVREFITSICPYVKRIELVIKSSPLCGTLYQNNPLVFLLASLNG